MRTSLLHKHGTQQERIGNVTDLTLMTFSTDPTTVLPSLTLLSHRVRVLPMDASSLVRMPENTILLLDARDDLSLIHIWMTTAISTARWAKTATRSTRW